MKTPYELGIEAQPITKGWAVYGGSEGEDPYFCGFFTDEATAIAFANTSLVFDPHVALAIVNSRTLYTANDYEIDNHDKLHLRVAQLIMFGGAP